MAEVDADAAADAGDGACPICGAATAGDAAAASVIVVIQGVSGKDNEMGVQVGDVLDPVGFQQHAPATVKVVVEDVNPPACRVKRAMGQRYGSRIRMVVRAGSNCLVFVTHAVYPSYFPSSPSKV